MGRASMRNGQKTRPTRVALRLLAWGAALSLSLSLLSPEARAQSVDASSAQENVRAAGNAYDKGTARYALRDYASAADWFELADRLAPATPALESAIRAHRQVGSPAHLARAATLAVKLRARAGSELATARFADEVVGSVADAMTRLTIQCDRCQVEIDGAVEVERDLFLIPGEHRVVGHFSDGRTLTKSVVANAGKREALDWMSAPAPAPPPVASSASPSKAPDTAPPGRFDSGATSSSRLAPAYAITFAGITAGLGAATAVSWFGDALPAGRTLIRNAESTHLADPGQESRVHGAETRTTVLLVATACVGAAALVIGTFFTEWRRGERASGEAWMRAVQGGARF